MNVFTVAWIVVACIVIAGSAIAANHLFGPVAGYTGAAVALLAVFIFRRILIRWANEDVGRSRFEIVLTFTRLISQPELDFFWKQIEDGQMTVSGPLGHDNVMPSMWNSMGNGMSRWHTLILSWRSEMACYLIDDRSNVVAVLVGNQTRGDPPVRGVALLGMPGRHIEHVYKLLSSDMH